MIRGPLITSGNYDFSYNQNYLLQRLHCVSVYWSYLLMFIVFILFIFVVIYLIMWFRLKGRTQELEIRSNVKLAQNFKLALDKFITIVKSYEEVKQVMGIPEKDANRLYLNDARELMELLMPYEKHIYQTQTYSTILMWDKYKKLFYNFSQLI